MTGYAETALVRGLSFLSESQASIAHNLANVDSTGFKRKSAVATSENARFQSMLEREMPTVGFELTTDFTPGTLRTTGEAGHIGIEGERNKDLFFRVKTADGSVAYTRSGQLQLDDQGRIVTTDGNRYLDTSGSEIQLGVDGTTLSGVLIEPNGQIRDRKDPTKQWGPIGVFKVEDLRTLRSIGDGLFKDDAALATAATPTSSVRQGHLEQSNVQSLDEMVRVMIVERTFQATSRMLGSVQRLQEAFTSVMAR